MTLDEFIKTYEGKETEFYIGSAVSFMFIGSKDEYYKEIDFVEDSILTSYEQYKKAREKTLELAIKDLEKSYDPNYIKDVKRRIKRYKTAVDNTTKKIESFISLRKREVLNNYIRQQGGVVVIIEGDETGKFWFKHEYKDFFKRGKGGK